MRITHADQLVFGHDHERISAFNAADGLDQIVVLPAEGWLRHEVQDDFTIDAGLEDRAVGFEFFAELRGIGKISVMRDGDLAFGAIDRERLGVAQMRRTGGGIARVADGEGAFELLQDARIKYLRDQPHAFVGAEIDAVRGHYPGAFLPSMLQGIQAVIRQFRGIRVTENAEDTAIMFWIRLHSGFSARKYSSR